MKTKDQILTECSKLLREESENRKKTISINKKLKALQEECGAIGHELSESELNLGVPTIFCLTCCARVAKNDAEVTV